MYCARNERYVRLAFRRGFSGTVEPAAHFVRDFFSCLGVLADLEEPLQNFLGRIATVLIEQVDVFDAPLGEASPVVAPLVEADHTRYPQLPEYWNIVLGEQRPFAGFHLSPTARG